MRQLLQTTLALCGMLALPYAVLADGIDDYVLSQMRKQHIPGLSLAVMREGKVMRAKGYGYSNLEWKTPVLPSTLFQSGSLGKQFTATAVMMLVEEGKIGLDDKISKYLEGTAVAWKDVTIRRLLSHTSGIGNIYKVLEIRQDYTEDDLVKKAVSVPVEFAPGAQWRYSNAGYHMLGVLIHKVTGKFYGDFLKERIFTPLGMDTARIISEEDIIPNRAAGYHLVQGKLKNQEWVSPTMNTTADGSLYLTALDMAKWDAALYTEKLLKRSSLEQMWTPIRLNDGTTYPYGFGWFLGKAHGHRLIEHGGAWQGFRSVISRFVDDMTTVVVFMNLGSPGEPTKIAHRVARFFIPALDPPKHRSVRIDPAHYSAYAGRYAFGSNEILTVAVENGHLTVQLPHGAADEYLPETETAFFSNEEESEVAFTKSGDMVTGLVYHQDGKETRAPRMVR